MLELERQSWEEVGVGVKHLMPCWPQEPAQHYSMLISVDSSIKVYCHLQWVNESTRLTLAFPLPGSHIRDGVVLFRKQCGQSLC